MSNVRKELRIHIVSDSRRWYPKYQEWLTLDEYAYRKQLEAEQETVVRYGPNGENGI